MKEILDSLPFGILVVHKNSIEYLNENLKEYLGLKLKGDPINIGTIQGRIGSSFKNLKDFQELKIFGRHYFVYKNSYEDKIIITVEKKREEKEESLSYLSHEIRAPLSSVIGSIQGLLDGLFGNLNEKQINFLNIALRNCKRIAEIVEEVFSYKAIDVGTDKIEFKPFSLFDFLNEVINSFEVSKKEKKVCIRERIDKEIKNYNGYGDRAKLIQVLTNLIINAYNHSKENSEILIEADLIKGEKDFAKISVTNFGKEIDESLKDKIFQPYFHLGEKRGLGLGLPLSKKIIEKHEGKMDFESKDGKTKFFFTFPVISLISKKILVAEDEKDLLEVIKNYLEKEGYQVFEALSGNEALKIFEEKKPDLVITDLMMPDGSGWDLLKNIGKSEKKPKTIVLSGLKSTLDHSIAKDILKADLFIDKPFDPRKLLEGVKNILMEVKNE